MIRGMRRSIWQAIAVVFFAGSAWAGGSTLRVSGGAHYWVALDDLDVSNFKTSGLSYEVGVQWRPVWLIGVEAACEYFPDGVGGATGATYAPQASLVIGQTLYGAVGIGTHFSDGSFASQPFYTLRAGVNIGIVPRLNLDIHASCQFVTWEHLDEQINGNTVALGAALRFGF